jgi:ribosomal protein L11 methyltransferase
VTDSKIKGQWVEITLDASAEAVDAIVEVLRGQGIGGVAVEPPVSPGADDGFTMADGPCLVKAYFPDEPDAETRVQKVREALWHLQAFDLAPLSDVRTRFVAEEDWANAWKEHFHPLRIGRRFVVKPSWREVTPQAGDIILELDPGMAFGTGLHPTTRMVLEAMEDRIPAGASVFDVGTGSGILAVAAAKLGVGSVLAVDVESVACRVAKENIELNGVETVVTVELGSADHGRTGYDVILANIIASVIALIAGELARQLAPAGTLIASGIIEERLPEVEKAFTATGLEIVERIHTDDWLCLVARHAGCA